MHIARRLSLMVVLGWKRIYVQFAKRKMRNVRNVSNRNARTAMLVRVVDLVLRSVSSS